MSEQAGSGCPAPTVPKVILPVITSLSSHIRYEVIPTSSTQKPKECSYEKHIIRKESVHHKGYRQGNHNCRLDASTEGVKVGKGHRLQIPGSAINIERSVDHHLKCSSSGRIGIAIHFNVYSPVVPGSHAVTLFHAAVALFHIPTSRNLCVSASDAGIDDTTIRDQRYQRIEMLE